MAVEPASVIGLEFAQPAVESLAPGGDAPNDVARTCAALTRKRFIDSARRGRRRGRSTGFTTNSCATRSTTGCSNAPGLHCTSNFVRWADRVNADRDRALEFQEILGYHLEQAHHYLAELGPLDEQGVAIGADAARRLSGAGRRAFARGDTHAAANLYRRAAALLDENDPKRPALLTEFGEVLMELTDFAQAHTVLAEAQAAAERAANRRIAASAQLLRMRIHLFSAEPGDSSEEMLRMADDAIPLFESRSGATASWHEPGA